MLAASKTLARISNGTPLRLFCLSRPRASPSTPPDTPPSSCFELILPGHCQGIGSVRATQRSNCKGLEGYRFMARLLEIKNVTERIKQRRGDELITGP